MKARLELNFVLLEISLLSNIHLFLMHMNCTEVSIKRKSTPTSLPQIMAQFCYLKLFSGVEALFLRLLDGKDGHGLKQKRWANLKFQCCGSKSHLKINYYA